MSDNGEKPELYCNNCGDCCRFFAIEKPIGKDDRVAGGVLFYNLHEGIEAFVRKDNEGNRFIHVKIYSRCLMLQEHADGTTSCKIYPNRPPICYQFPLKPGTGTTKDLPNCTMLVKSEEALESVKEEVTSEP